MRMGNDGTESDLVGTRAGWKIHRRRLTTILIVFMMLLVSAARLGAQVPSPDSVLGFHIGDDRKLADWSQVVDYFQEVAAAAPDRVKFEEVGKSTLGKPFVALVISSADNMKNLDHYREIQQRLADPRGLTDAEADALVHQGKAMVLITCTVHSTEVASTQTAMEYVYKLLTEDTPEHQEILNNVIFLLVPSINPDGQDMVVKWYRKYVGTPYEGAMPVELYHPYVGHDDNRDWYMFTQVESRLTVGKVQNVWHPQVVYDVHQMGPNAARLFVPPFLDPVDPNIDPLLVEETNWLGTTMAAALATDGKKGVAVNAMYDEWTPARHYQAYHAGLRILTESASARLASPIGVPFSALATTALGYNAQQRSWNYSDPWPGGEWRLGDIVSYQLIAFEACLDTVAKYRERFLRNFYEMGKHAVEWKGPPYAYVFPPEQKDTPAEVKLLNTLRFGLVEVDRATQTFTADGISYPEGSYVIPLAQPYGHYAKTLLERQRYPDLREYPGGPPKRPYDVTAQTLPLLMGVTTVEVDHPFEVPMVKVDEVPLPPGKVEGQGTTYLLRPDSNNAYTAVNRLFKQGVKVARLPKTTLEAGKEFPAGTFVVSGGDVRALSGLGVNFTAVRAAPAEAVPLRQPRVGLYKSYVASIDEGWTRWLLEQYEFPYTSIHDKDVRAGDLKSRFDVIVIPDETVNAIVNGNPRLPHAGASDTSASAAAPGGGFNRNYEPDEYTGGLGSSGVESLRAFVMEGGTLVALNRSSDFAIEKLGVGAKDILDGVPNKDFYGPGSILRIEVNPNHPLGYGMPHESIAWFERSPVFSPAFMGADAPGAETVAEYPDGNPLMSGWLLGDGLIQDRAALVDAPLGHGHVVLFGFRPQYRGQSYATYKMLFNSLLYFTP
jgi:Zinc carboxypeptidase